ncbi:PAS domain-containing sensor histidine kinase [Romboutsia sp. Marseille-P6047]|uniref:PAS domain-containing sensor histidine kinase n=1 Tax=Romboutsia sp. Marseille-P6047 TaxID=2161817 RepID=UPI0013DE3A16|nr:ATP-binding protein [Romboutsia sp. Marseille-P6047]
MNLYEYREVLSLLNTIILISIATLSIGRCFLNKSIIFMIVSLIYCVEVCVNIYIGMQSINKSKLYIIAAIFIIKILMIILFYKKINFKLYLNFIIAIGYLFSIISLSASYELSLIISIISNLLLIHLGVINNIKKLRISVSKNKHKLKLNKKYISKSIKEIESESNLKQDLNEKVMTLNCKIESTIEALNIPIFVLNSELDYIYGNKEFEKFLKEEDIKLKKENVLISFKEKLINFDDMLNNINFANHEINNIVKLKTYDNKIFKFTCNLDIINDRELKICLLEDITKDINIKNELKESETKYRKLMDIINDGVIIHSIDTINYLNDKALELFNINKNMDKVLLIDDIKNNIIKKHRKEFLQNINLVKCGKEEKSVCKIETEYGKIIEFITTHITLNNTNMMLSIAVDITGLEEVKNQLEESEKTYKLLLQALPEGIVIIDKKTKLHIYRNRSMIKILKSVGADKFNEIIKEYIDNGDYGKFKRFRLDNDENADISIAITDSKEDNNLVCVASMLDDEYRAEQMKEKLNEMKDKYKFKTEFLYTMCNNLKKPINTIFEVNKILQNNESRKEFKYIDNYSRVVRQNSYRLKRLLNNIDEISKIENGTLDMNYSRCDIVKFIENIVRLSREYAKYKNLEILFITNIKKKIILIDKSKIEKIILNLLSNSIKFTNSNGKIMVSVNTDKDNIIISVEDTGVGIPSEKIDTIFENFEQVDTTLSRGAEGTGVGLALVKQLVKAHNAKINVYSKVGCGSKFEVILDNNKVIELNEDKGKIDKSTDIENIDIEFSDIYFDLGS